MKPKISGLGLAFMSPALLLLIAFFFTPVILTAVFSFTNMSTATGIGPGAYVLSPNLMSTLRQDGMSPKVISAISAQHIAVDTAHLDAAAKGGVDPRFLSEIKDRLSGKKFTSMSAFERALKRLQHRPRRIRELKLAAAYFQESALNTRFAQRGEFIDALQAIAPDVPATTIGRVADAAYTGAVFTPDNFGMLFSKPGTWRIIGNTVLYVGATLAFNVLVGLFLAVTTFYLPKAGAGIFSVVWLLPRITPVVLYAILWKWFTWDNGFLPTLASYVGLPSFNYMKGSVTTAWTLLILINGFVGASFGMILFSSALRTIPIQQLWASEVDGATRWQQVRRIILPQLRWPILFVTSYQTLSLLSSYDIIWLTTNGGPGNTTTVWSLEAFQTALFNYSGNLQYGLGAAMALVLVVVGLTLSIAYLMLFRFDDLVTQPRIEF